MERDAEKPIAINTAAYNVAQGLALVLLHGLDLADDPKQRATHFDFDDFIGEGINGSFLVTGSGGKFLTIDINVDVHATN